MTAHTKAILFLLEEHRLESVNPHATSACVRHKEAVEAEVKAMEPPPVHQFPPLPEPAKEEGEKKNGGNLMEPQTQSSLPDSSKDDTARARAETVVEETVKAEPKAKR